MNRIKNRLAPLTRLAAAALATVGILAAPFSVALRQRPRGFWRDGREGLRTPRGTIPARREAGLARRPGGGVGARRALP